MRTLRLFSLDTPKEKVTLCRKISCRQFREKVNK